MYKYTALVLLAILHFDCAHLAPPPSESHEKTNILDIIKDESVFKTCNNSLVNIDDADFLEKECSVERPKNMSIVNLEQGRQFRCLAYYDINVRICTAKQEAGALKLNLPTDKASMDGVLGSLNDTNITGDFCKEAYKHLTSDKNFPETFKYVDLFIDKIKNTVICQGICWDLANLLPTCKIILWGNKILSDFNHNLDQHKELANMKKGAAVPIKSKDNESAQPEQTVATQQLPLPTKPSASTVDPDSPPNKLSGPVKPQQTNNNDVQGLSGVEEQPEPLVVDSPIVKPSAPKPLQQPANHGREGVKEDTHVENTVVVAQQSLPGPVLQPDHPKAHPQPKKVDSAAIPIDAVDMDGGEDEGDDFSEGMGEQENVAMAPKANDDDSYDRLLPNNQDGDRQPELRPNSVDKTSSSGAAVRAHAHPDSSSFGALAISLFIVVQLSV